MEQNYPNLPHHYYADKRQVIGLCVIFCSVALGLIYAAIISENDPNPKLQEDQRILAVVAFSFMAALLVGVSIFALWRAFWKRLPVLSLLEEGVATKYDENRVAQYIIPWKYIAEATDESGSVQLKLKYEDEFRLANPETYEFIKKDGMILPVDMMRPNELREISKIINHYAKQKS